MSLNPAYPDSGGGSTPIDLKDGSIPKVIGGELVESAMVEDSVEVLSGLTIEAPAASLKLGANMVLSNHGEIVQYSNSAYGDETLPVIAFHDDDGSLTPVNYKLEPFEINNSQLLDGDSFSGTEFRFVASAPLFRGTVLTLPFGTLVLELTFRGDGVQTDGLRITMRIDSYSGSIIWQSHNEVEFQAGVGFTVNATGDTTLRLEAPFILRDGETLYVTFDVLPTNIISLKGNISTEFVPYLITKIQQVSREPMATEEYADNAAADWGDIGGTLADQTDLQTALDTKLENGDNVSELTNDAEYLTGISSDTSLSGAGTSGDPLSVSTSIQGGIRVIGFWDADANTPDLSALTLDQGEAYQVSVAGSTSLNGETNWKAKDLVVWSDALAGNWFKLDNTDDVLSVNSQTGAVLLDTDDIPEATSLYYTEARVDANTNVSANTNHKGLTNNPHSVSSAQVGLGSVDNTSDVDKPISTVQAAAFGQVDSVVAGTGVSVDNTDPKNPIVSASSAAASKLYAFAEDNGLTTSLTLNDWVQVNVSTTLSPETAGFTDDGAGVFTYTGADPKVFDFDASLSQKGIGNDKTCEFAWFKDNTTQMGGKQDTDMSSSKFYGPATPAAVVSLANGDNMRVCMRNTEDSSNTKIVNSWFKIKEWK